MRSSESTYAAHDGPLQLGELQATGYSSIPVQLAEQLSLELRRGLLEPRIRAAKQSGFNRTPLVALLLGLSAITVPWDTLITSVALYIVVPVILAQIIRRTLLAQGAGRLDRTVAALGPYAISALLLTLVLLFAFQGEAITAQPLIIAILAVPILTQVIFNSGLAYLLNRQLGVAHCVAGPSALIGASNFFELAVATAISLFGFHSGAALATVVGVLIEVPIMLVVVSVVNRSRTWYEAKI